jgi:chlorobactene glucosyltransferase
MITLWVLTGITGVVTVAFAVYISLFLRYLPVLRPAPASPDDAPLVSIIVPARNEATNIERCVCSLLAQNYTNIEVIAVDDASTDATPHILARLAASDSRLRIVAGRPLPKGWTGKNNAVYQGVLQARGSWLLFVDADVSLHEGALSAAYRAAREHTAAMVTLWARQELRTFWECVVQPVIIGMNQSSDPLLRVNNLRYPDAAFANGQFILVDREAYAHIGGHVRVRDEVVEDQKLSWQLKHAGYRLLMMDGTRVLSTRMYDSLSGIWEGWSKNNFLTLNRNLLMVLGASLAVYFITVSPFLLTIWALLAFKFTNTIFDPLVINLCAIALVLGTRWRVRSFFPTPLRFYLWHALGGLIFISIMVNSAYRHSQRRGVTWKGRRYGDVDPVG